MKCFLHHSFFFVTLISFYPLFSIFIYHFFSVSLSLSHFFSVWSSLFVSQCVCVWCALYKSLFHFIYFWPFSTFLFLVIFNSSINFLLHIYPINDLHEFILSIFTFYMVFFHFGNAISSSVMGVWMYECTNVMCFQNDEGVKGYWLVKAVR